MATDETRYGRVASALHWLIGFALLGQIAFGFALDELAPRGTPARAGVINLHKSIGLVLLVLIVTRLAWRIAHAVPRWPIAMPAWQRRAATLGHRALYFCMLAMPLTGYVGSNLSRHGLKFFGLALKPWGPDWPAAYRLMTGLHEVIAWAFVLLIAGHVAMAALHAWRDGLPSLGRIGFRKLREFS